MHTDRPARNGSLAGHGFLLDREIEQRLAGLDPDDAGTAIGQHPTQVAVAAAGVQHPLAVQVTEHAQHGRIDQMALGEVAVLDRLLQDRMRHGTPPLDRRLVGPLGHDRPPAIIVASVSLFASRRQTVACRGRRGPRSAASRDVGRLRRMVGGTRRLTSSSTKGPAAVVTW